MLLLAFPVVVQSQFTFTTNNGAITITGYTGSGGAVTIPSSINGLPVTNIDGRAFYQSHLTSITIPRSLAEIDVRWFYMLDALTNITILGNDTRTGSNPDHAVVNDRLDLDSWPFYTMKTASSSADGVLFDKRQTVLIKCPEGKTGNYTIPNGTTIIGPRAFSYCRCLTSITIPDSVTNIMNDAFAFCPGLTSITIGNGVQSIEDAFESCINLTNVVIGRSVKNIGGAPFYSCFALSTISVDAQNPDYSSSEGVVFNKHQTVLIKCPEGKAGKYTIPNGVSKIADSAFQSCTHLTNITLPKSVTKIGDQAFYLCGATGFYFQGNAPSVGTDAFNRNNTVTLYHLPDTRGWRSTLAGVPTAAWKP